MNIQNPHKGYSLKDELVGAFLIFLLICFLGWAGHEHIFYNILESLND